MSVKRKVESTILLEKNKKSLEESRQAYTTLLQVAIKTDDIESRLQIERKLRNLDDEEREIEKLLESELEEDEVEENTPSVSSNLLNFYNNYPQLSPKSSEYSPEIAEAFEAHLSEQIFNNRKKGNSKNFDTHDFYVNVLKNTLDTLDPKEEKEEEVNVKNSPKTEQKRNYEVSGEDNALPPVSSRSSVLTPEEQSVMLATAPYEMRNDPKQFQAHIKQTLALKNSYKHAPVISEEFNNKKILIETDKLRPYVLGDQ